MKEKTSIIIIAGLGLLVLILGGMLLFKNDSITPTITMVTPSGYVNGVGYELTYATSGVDLNKVIVGCKCEHLSLPIATPSGNNYFGTISIGD